MGAKEEFERVYKMVDSRLAPYIESIQAPEDRQWFGDLQRQFRESHTKWTSSDVVHPALVAADRLPNSPLRVAVLVYLHICYDLPITIAPTLRGLSVRTLAQRRQVFMQADGNILNAFRDALESPDVLGRGWISLVKLARSRILLRYLGPLGDLAVAGFGDSVIRKRWMAWDNAVAISEKPLLERKLARHIREFFTDVVAQDQIYMGVPRLLPGWLAWVSDQMNYSQRPGTVLYDDCYYTLSSEDPFFDIDNFEP